MSAKSCSTSRRVSAEVVQRLAQPSEGLVSRNGAFKPPLHGSSNGRRTKLTCEVNHRSHKLPRLPADLRIGMAKVPLMNHPTGARAHCRQIKLMLVEQIPE